MLKIGLDLVLPPKIMLLLSGFLFLSFNVQGQSGLIKAMSFEDAEKIAVKSIRRTSGIRVKEIDFKSIKTNDDLKKLIENDKYARNCLDRKKLDCIFKHEGNCPDAETSEDKKINLEKLKNELNENCFPYKRLRLTDTLDFLGISDEFRLAALRRYIVRNVEFGVKSVWGSDNNGVAHFFVISGKQLEDVKTSTTVLDLAKKIQSVAALPFLSNSMAELLVRNCRNKITGKKDKFVIENAFIKDDLGNSATGKFIKCLEEDVLKEGDPVTFKDENARKPANLKRYRYGVRSVKIIDNEGDNKFYFLTLEFQKNLNDKILTKNLTYKELLEDLIESAGIPASDDFLATRIVVNALLSIAKEKNLNRPPLLFRPLEFHRVSEILRQIRKLGCPSSSLPDDRISVKTTLQSLCVLPATLLEKIEAESANKKSSYLLLNQNDYLVNLNRIKVTAQITEQSTIEQIIEAVEKKIKSQRKSTKIS